MVMHTSPYFSPMKGPPMPIVYVAMSITMQEWGADVGVSKQLYKVGFADGDPQAAVEELCDESYAGHSDWQLAASRDVEDDLDENVVLQRASDRQKTLDPLYYPRIKGAKDIVRLDQRKVEANIVIKKTMEGKDSKVPKLKPSDMAEFLIESVLQ
jgi:hypothetical protein